MTQVRVGKYSPRVPDRTLKTSFVHSGSCSMIADSNRGGNNLYNKSLTGRLIDVQKCTR